MLDETLGDYITKLRDQSFLHKHLVEFALLSIDQKTPYCFIQVIENFLEVSIDLLLDHLLENLEKDMHIRVAYFESNYWTFDCQESEASFE